MATFATFAPNYHFLREQRRTGGCRGKVHANFFRTRKKYHEDSLGTWGRASRAPMRPCTQAVLVVSLAWAQEISASFTTTPAWVHGSPPLLPQEIMPLAIVLTAASRRLLVPPSYISLADQTFVLQLLKSPVGTNLIGQ